MQISPSYVKQAYSLAWRFFTFNKATSFIAMFVVFGLYMFSLIPILGLVFGIAAGLALFSMQTYVAKTLMDSSSDEEFNEKVQATGVKELFTKHIGVAGGGFLGFIVIEIIMFVVIFTMFVMTVGLEALTTLNDQNMPPEKQMEIFQSIGIVGIIVMVMIMFFAYIYPIVLGKVYTSENFGEAFSSIFTMFSPVVWKASFNGQYFLMITMLHLTAIGMFIAMVISIMTIVLIPVAMFVAYLFLVYATTTAVLSREIVFEGHEDHSEDE